MAKHVKQAAKSTHAIETSKKNPLIQLEDKTAFVESYGQDLNALKADAFGNPVAVPLEQSDAILTEKENVDTPLEEVADKASPWWTVSGLGILAGLAGLGASSGGGDDTPSSPTDNPSPESSEITGGTTPLPNKPIVDVPVKPAPEPVKPAPEPVKPAPEPVKPAPEPVKPVTPTLSGAKAFAKDNIPVGEKYKIVENLQQAKEASKDSSLKYIVISDDSHHAVFEKGNTNGSLTNSWNGNTWGADFKEYVPIIAFADKLTGNVTTAFQTAAKLASKLKLGIEFPDDAAYTVTDNVLIADGVKFIHGNDSVLTAEGMGEHTNIIRLMRGTSNIEISEFTLDLNGLSTVAGVLASDPQNLSIHDINFVNVGYRAINVYTSLSGAKNVTIENNTISAPVGNASNKGDITAIAISNVMDVPKEYKGTHNPIWNQFIKEGTVAANLYVASDMKIINNQIDGGYYGISLSGVTNSEISGNSVTNNMRNISLQNNASGNNITNNHLSNSISSSVHIAYNSDNNKISNNTIVSEKASGQGILQAYQGSDNNIFNNNSIEMLSPTGPGWALYTATGSGGNRFTDNIVDSKMTHSLVGVESVWDSKATNGDPASLMVKPANDPFASKTPITYNGGKGDLNNIVIDNNIFLPGYEYRPLLYAGAYSSGGLNGKENIVGDVGLSFKGNTIFGENYSQLTQIKENGASVNLNAANNTVLNSAVNKLTGTAATDIFFIDHVNDQIIDTKSGDADWAYSAVSYTIGSGVENLRLLGEKALIGTGNSSDNVLLGNAYNNTLNGMAGDDILIGGYGNNILTGGAGADTFVFSSPLNGQIDRITDFNVKEDKLALSKVIFGKLSGDWFAEDIASISSDTRVFQDGKKLYYDADGSGKYFNSVQFVELQSAMSLTKDQFEII